MSDGTKRAAAPPSPPRMPLTILDHKAMPEVQPVDYQASPWQLLFSDTMLLLREAPYALLLFWPLNLREGWVFQDLTFFGAIFQFLCLAVSFGVSALAVVSIFLGTPSIFISLLISVAAMVPLLLVQGRLVIKARRPPPNPEKFSREAWFFVNGIATSRSGAELAVQRLQDLFGRPITGIHNQTLGIFFDLVECLFQRDLSYRTRDIREGYALVKNAVLDPGKSRVVIIAHSQGGIIASAWADSLLADVDRERLSRVEFYTFASAANHFSAPPGKDGEGPWANVEHFANGGDFVSRIGVLAFAKPNPRTSMLDTTSSAAWDGTTYNIDALKETARQQVAQRSDATPVTSSRFAGRLFLSAMSSGHLLVDHYLGVNSNILDIPAAKRSSRIANYMGGANAAT